VLAAHVSELRAEDVLDDAGFAAIAGALDAIAIDLPQQGSLYDRMREIADRVEARIPPDFATVTTLGLAREEWQATAVRLIWTDRSATVAASLSALRRSLVDLADAHAMSLMPATMAGRPAQPTMLGHLLGTAIGPLASAAADLHCAATRMARSPLGAGVLAGEMIATDRERSARRLGLKTPIPNTFDAVANTADAVAVLQSTSAALVAARRLVNEFATWIRTNPNALMLTDDWSGRPEPSIPTLATGGRVQRLLGTLSAGIADADAAVTWLRELPLEPLGEAHASALAIGERLLGEHAAALDEVRLFLTEGVLVNRAWLGNRAGRGHTTLGDLAMFLMTEEQLPPAAARAIASIVASRLDEQQLESSDVTQEMVDSAALMVIGREVKVEFERLGRYLAPRRFLERRIASGTPASESLRAYLDGERQALETSPVADVAAALDRLAAEIVTAASDTD
jgi:argininosuccinate lyase